MRCFSVPSRPAMESDVRSGDPSAGLRAEAVLVDVEAAAAARAEEEVALQHRRLAHPRGEVGHVVAVRMAWAAGRIAAVSGASSGRDSIEPSPK